MLPPPGMRCVRLVALFLAFDGAGLGLGYVGHVGNW